ncbi:MAG: hypothetical protein ACR2J7_04125 [Luteimonas sp.]
MSTNLRSIVLAMCAGALVALAGCVAPSPDASGLDETPSTPGAAGSSPAQAAGAPRQADPGQAPSQPDRLPAAPPMSDPLPPERMPSPVALDYSCRVEADCAVKNVGNCCGMMPAGVNKDSRSDPAAVQAECARSGLSSVCGFVEIQACSCVRDRCEPQQAGAAVTR